MTETIAIIAAGHMGSAIGGILTRGGACVLTSLQGRSAATKARADRNGFEIAATDKDIVAQSGFLLSIVPPGEALALAQRFAPVLARSATKPVYVDCNAIAPKTAHAAAAVVAAAGCRFVDGGIIGPPPKPNAQGTKIYVAGEAARSVARLADFGLDIRVLDAPNGAASALKMSYAGLTKGFTALGAAMMLAASRAGASDALHGELADSRPDFLPYLQRSVPVMFSKAYRWVAEMEEIAAFTDDPAAAEIYNGMAKLYARLAQTFDAARTPDDEIAALERFCADDSTARKRGLSPLPPRGFTRVPR